MRHGDHLVRRHAVLRLALALDIAQLFMEPPVGTAGRSTTPDARTRCANGPAELTQPGGPGGRLEVRDGDGRAFRPLGQRPGTRPRGAQGLSSEAGVVRRQSARTSQEAQVASGGRTGITTEARRSGRCDARPGRCGSAARRGRPCPDVPSTPASGPGTCCRTGETENGDGRLAGVHRDAGPAMGRMGCRQRGVERPVDPRSAGHDVGARIGEAATQCQHDSP